MIIKISRDYENILAQYIEPNDLVTDQELSDFGTMNFTLPITEGVQFLERFMKVALYSNDIDEKLIFSGVIYDIDDDENNFYFKCLDEKGFMRERMLYTGTTFSTTIKDALASLVSSANTRAGNSFFSYSSNLDLAVNKTFEKGANYYEILNEFADLLNAEWTVIYGEIIFNSTIGKDRTTGADFVELISDIDNPNENNIKFRGRRRGDEVANAIIGKNTSGYSTQEDISGSDFNDRIEKFVSVDDGSITEQTLAYLNKSKLSQREIECFVENLSYDQADVGDLLKLRINRGNNIQDYIGSIKVITKRIQIRSGTALLSLTLSKENKKIKSPKNKLAILANSVKKLQLQ